MRYCVREECCATTFLNQSVCNPFLWKANTLKAKDLTGPALNCVIIRLKDYYYCYYFLAHGYRFSAAWVVRSSTVFYPLSRLVSLEEAWKAKQYRKARKEKSLVFFLCFMSPWDLSWLVLDLKLKYICICIQRERSFFKPCTGFHKQMKAGDHVKGLKAPERLINGTRGETVCCLRATFKASNSNCGRCIYSIHGWLCLTLISQALASAPFCPKMLDTPACQPTKAIKCIHIGGTQWL